MHENFFIFLSMAIGFLGGLGGQIWVSDLFRREKLPENLDKSLKVAKSENAYSRRILFALKGERPTLKELASILPIFIPAVISAAFSGWIAGISGFVGVGLGALGWGFGFVIRKIANYQFDKKNKIEWKPWFQRQTRRAAITSLATVPVDQSVSALKKVINKLDDKSFLFLVPELKKLPKEVVSEVMLVATKNNRSWIRKRALEILAWHFPKTVEANMKTFIAHYDREMRKVAYNALLRLPRSRTLKWIELGKKDSLPQVVYQVLEVERKLNARTAWPDFEEESAVNVYADFLPEVQKFWEGFLNASWEEADALRALTDHAQMEDWVRFLETIKHAPEEPFVRTVIRMLEEHPRAPLITASLLKLMLHEDPAIQLAAEEALEAKGHRPVQAIRAHWGSLHDGVKEKLIGRVPDLKQQDRKDLYNTFLQALKDEKPTIRWKTLESIQRIDQTWLLNLLLLYCKRMPGPNAAAYADQEWVAARTAIDRWLERLPTKINTVESAVCTNCLTRGKVLTRSIWKVPGCRKCEKHEHLQANVTEIVGRIGPPLDTSKPVGSLFPVDLWDPEKRQATYADVDRVEIIGGAEIDYDWAVTAVLETLKNSDEPQRGKVPFNLLEDPPLSVNTGRMIRNRE